MDKMGKKIEKIRVMLKKEGVNAAILGFEGHVTTSWYADYPSKLVLLNAAEVEIMVKNTENIERADIQLNNRVPHNINEGDPKYIG